MSETPGSVASILQPLIDAAGADRVRPADPVADAVDGVVPRLVVAPADEEALARVLAFCHRHRLAVAPRGGGTQLGLGGIPERLDVLVDVARLGRIVQYEPADLTVTVQA
ncbi:MAG TPA: FAD-binding protein, partial [Limnochordales bacterium]